MSPYGTKENWNPPKFVNFVVGQFVKNLTGSDGKKPWYTEKNRNETIIYCKRVQVAVLGLEGEESSFGFGSTGRVFRCRKDVGS